MAYDFKPFEKELAEVAEWLKRELSGIRTGRATPAILDSVMVESYGTRLPVAQVATVSVDDARTLRIAPWDAGQTKEIEKAIIQANLGLSVGADEKGVRVFFPELTTERRESLMKIAKEKMEEARGRVRQLRDDVWSEIQEMERVGTIPEDDKFRAKDDMQKRVDATNEQFEDLLLRKEKEMTS